MSFESDDGELADRLLAMPILLTEDELVVAAPGELASSAALWVTAEATRLDCQRELGQALRRYATSKVGKILSASNFEIVGVAEIDQANATMITTKVDSTTPVLFVVVGDDFAGYAESGPDGWWSAQPQIEGLADRVQIDSDEVILVVATVTGFRARVVFVPSVSECDWVTLDVHNLLLQLRLAWADKPLDLIRFARASTQLTQSTRVWSTSDLGLLGLYRDNQDSFYLSDDRMPDVLMVDEGAEFRFRVEERRRFDYHAVPVEADSAIEAFSQFGTQWSPIYVINDRRATTARLIEHPLAMIWVRGMGVESEFVDLCAYWLWQIAVAADAAGWHGCAETLRVALRETSDGETVLGEPFRWRRVGEHQWTLLVDASQITRSRDVHNEVDRTFVRTLIGCLGSWFGLANADAIVDAIAPPGPKRMLFVGSGALTERYDEQVANRTILVESDVTGLVLDELGRELFAGSTLPIGAVAQEEVVPLLNRAVAILMGHLVDEIAAHAANEILPFLVRQSEAIETKKYLDALRRPARVACYGQALFPVDEVTKESSKLIEAALANRFLLEMASATQPSGSTVLSRDRYDRLLALAHEIIARGMASDAAYYGLTSVEVSRLASGRIGTAQHDPFFAGASAFSAAQMARDLDALPNQFELETEDFWAFRPDEVNAWTAEYGFAPTELRDVLLWIYEAYPSSAHDHVVAVPKASLASRTAAQFAWDVDRVDQLISALTIGPTETYQLDESSRPWRFGRERSYVRRPFVEISSSVELLFSRTRLLGALGDRLQEYRSGRVTARTTEMRSVVGSIRERQTLAYEREVAHAFERLNFDIVRQRVKKFGSTHIAGPDRNTLGDIDTLAVDIRTKLVVVAEAKD